ncbi:MAG: endolytic transglycosylase MltG [bacterium]
MKKAGCLIFIIIIVLIGLYGLFLVNKYNSAIDYKATSTDKVLLTIESGESPTQVKEHLIEKGIIKDEEIAFGFSAYRIYAYITKFDTKIQAGSYQLSKGLSIKEIAELLQRAESQELKITLKEGMRIEEIAEKLNIDLNSSDNRNSKFNKNEFIDLAKNYVSDRDFLSSRPRGNNSLEGYLFPDTYFITPDATAKDLIELMLDNFDLKLFQPNSGSIKNNKYTLHELVSLASIIQREVQTPNDMSMIADIYFKRLRDDWKLEADATTQYAIGYSTSEGVWWKKNLTYDDLDSSSPYNTRKFSGIPPSPISSFGVTAFQAVLEPKANNYFFYISDKDCVTRYAKTFYEHEANISKYGTCT